MSFDGSAVDTLLQNAVEGGTYEGVAAMVVDRDGTLYEGYAGAAGEDTLFRNASMTKAVATTGALQLHEQGRLELDTTVESILPEFAEIQVLEGFDGDDAILRPPVSQATIRQLMTHTSGLSYFFLNADLLRYATESGVPSPLEGIKSSLTAPMGCDPGASWEYGVNTDWLGLVVEELSGQTLASYLGEHVYGPLGMLDSTFDPTEEQRERLLPVRARAADGSLQPTELDLPATSEWDAGGHGSYGTARDYSRFVRAWLREGELDGARVLSPETCALALEDHIEGVPMPEGLESCMPELANDVPPFPFQEGWGLGFHLVKEDVPGMRTAGTGDWSGIFNTYFWIDRTAGVGALIMTQILPFFDDKVVEALLGFEAAVYAQVGATASA